MSLSIRINRKFQIFYGKSPYAIFSLKKLPLNSKKVTTYEFDRKVRIISLTLSQPNRKFMKTILCILLLAFSISAKAQFTLEHTYDSASVLGFCPGSMSQLMLVKFEQSGERYVRINRCGKSITLYDLNHALVKTISLAGIPIAAAPFDQMGDILYLSENLFNTDSKMEFMYIPPNGTFTTAVYNEDGTLLFAEQGAAMIKPNFEQQQLPIYNTSQGTKLILSYPNGQAKVFGLGGTLTTDIQPHGNTSLPDNTAISGPVPNPSSSQSRIDYALPDGVNEGNIVFYDLQGKEVKQFRVDRSFDHLLISTSDLVSGTYYYHLQVSGQNSSAKKLVVIH